MLWQETLYVSVTASQLADGSKRAFVSLLEYAEEELGVSNVVACLDKCVLSKEVNKELSTIPYAESPAQHQFLCLLLLLFTKACSVFFAEAR